MTKTINNPSARRSSTNSPNPIRTSFTTKLNPQLHSSQQQQQQRFDNAPSSPRASERNVDDQQTGSKQSKAPASLLMQVVAKNHQQVILEDKQRGSPRQQQQDEQPQELTHDGNNASIVLDEQLSTETPWTPKSLGRAKTAIIYKQTLNDTLLVLERNIFFFNEWVPYFVSLQEDHILMFKSRERWEQGLKPDKIIKLHHMLLLGEMKVEASTYDSYDGNSVSRLFRRKLLETDEMDEWLNEEFHQNLIVGSVSRAGGIISTNPNASARCTIEFASYNQSTFELWTKSIRRVLQVKREQHSQDASTFSNRYRDDDGDSQQSNNASPSRQEMKKAWVSPGQDSRLTLHQSEIWCNRVLSGEKEKAESEIRRIIAMEKLVAQVTNPRMALLVYEKVSRVHELFVANSRREIEELDDRESRISVEILNFFADHLKRKYSVFLILALAYGVGEEQIRDAHETMCLENAASYAGVGGGSGELERPVSSHGFEDPESLELYEKYRDAAINYHKMNYGDSSAAEEEDAIMHLPVMLQVAIVRRDHEETTAMLSIMETIKARLTEHCVEQENDS